MVQVENGVGMAPVPGYADERDSAVQCSDDSAGLCGYLALQAFVGAQHDVDSGIAIGVRADCHPASCA